VIVDDFKTGARSRVAEYAGHELALDEPGVAQQLASVMHEERVEAVIHFAAIKRVDESVRLPMHYLRRNLGGLAAVLEAMVIADVGNLVVSSSAAVYGEAKGVVSEAAPTIPASPYGQSKLAGEWLTSAMANAHGLRAVSLRYFNVAGAGWPDLADTAALNLIPMIFERLDAGQPPLIFGDDYDTADGTCVRDFVHVSDVAQAHLAVLDALPLQTDAHRVFNVGVGTGSSVREVVESIRRRAPSAPESVVQGRRAGDAAEVIADVRSIAAATGWRASYSLEQIIESAWQSHKAG